jgi:hypothetical protein
MSGFMTENLFQNGEIHLLQTISNSNFASPCIATAKLAAKPSAERDADEPLKPCKPSHCEPSLE